MTEHGRKTNLTAVFTVVGPGPNALYNGLPLPDGARDAASVVKDHLNEENQAPRATSPSHPVKIYNALMWGEPTEAPGVANKLTGAIRRQFLRDRGNYLTSESRAHLEAVRTVAESASSSASELTGRSTEDLVIRQLRRRKNVLVEGVAGSGKSHLLKDLTDHYDGNVEFVVFHPSTTYEDFVRGVRPVTFDNGSGREFEIADGVFLETCKRAWASAISDEPEEFLLFIDEINRANTARVLGDLLCVIEDSKRVDPSSAATPEPESCLTAEPVPNSVRLLVSADEHPAHLRVPSNLHIIGTMNSTDRSVGTLDLALQRRFGRVFQAPMTAGELRAALEQEDGREITVELVALVEWYGELNSRLRQLVGPDAQVGHSYFFGRTGFLTTVQDISEQIFAQLTEIVRVFACEDKLEQLTPATGDGVHPFGWRLVLRGQRLGTMPVLETTPPLASQDESRSAYQDDEQ